MSTQERYSTLELFIHDPTVNAPQLDHDANAPEPRPFSSDPQVVISLNYHIRAQTKGYWLGLVREWPTDYLLENLTRGESYRARKGGAFHSCHSSSKNWF